MGSLRLPPSPSFAQLEFDQSFFEFTDNIHYTKGESPDLQPAYVEEIAQGPLNHELWPQDSFSNPQATADVNIDQFLAQANPHYQIPPFIHQTFIDHDHDYTLPPVYEQLPAAMPFGIGFTSAPTATPDSAGYDHWLEARPDFQVTDMDSPNGSASPCAQLPLALSGLQDIRSRGDTTQAEPTLHIDQLLAQATADHQIATSRDHLFAVQRYTSTPPPITEQSPFQIPSFDERFFKMQKNTSMPFPVIEQSSPQMLTLHDRFFTAQNHTSMPPPFTGRPAATLVTGSGPISTPTAITNGAESNSWFGVRPDLATAFTSSLANPAIDSAPVSVSWPRLEDQVSQDRTTLPSRPAIPMHKKRSCRSAKGSKRYPRHNRMTDDYSAESFPELSPQEILDGGNGGTCIASHDIDGPVILKVAAEFTNEEIHSHISRLQKREGFVAKGYNCITKRITNSLEHWAKQTGCSCTAETNKFMSNWREQRVGNLKALGKAGNAVSFRNRPLMSADAMARQRK